MEQVDRGNYIDKDCKIKGASTGPLKGLTFAAKDLYDIKGYKTGFGNPTWAATHEVATHTSPAVQALLDAGADLVGKTHLDELAYSLNGENYHYGTPINPACPERIPGGSSSGSVVAVKEGSADIALGSDTGGSVRVPASYCGTFGLRPTHGRVSMKHAAPLAASFDTGGFFASSVDLLRKAADVLLATGSGQKCDVKFTRVLLGTDIHEMLFPETMTAFQTVLDSHSSKLAELAGEPTKLKVATLEGQNSLDAWRDVFRITQGADAWAAHAEWITANKPDFGPGIKERFHGASQLQPDEIKAAQAERVRITQHMEELLGQDGVLLMPTAPGPAPFRNTPPAELDAFRNRLLCMTCIAGLASLPQVSLPLLTVEGCPVGVSLVGPRYSDEALLQLAEKVFLAWKPQ